MSLIRNIIFDFGGVIYDIDYERAVKAFMDLGVSDFDKMYSKATQNHIFEDFESGLISPHEFRAKLKSTVFNHLNDSQIDFAWNALLVGFRKERLDLLEELRSNYNIFLLSNSNVIHYQIFLEEFCNLTPYDSFDQLFIKAYFSFDMKCRKPDIKAYKHVINEACLVADQSLFIDDSIQNIAPAKEAGLKTYYLNLIQSEDITDLFVEGALKESVLSSI